MQTFDFDSVRDRCLSKSHATEALPFDAFTLVFKVGDKVFAIANLDAFSGFSVKCDPDKAVELREQYQGVRPGFHLNKRHWNSVDADADVPHKLAMELLDHSYDMVVAGMTKKYRYEHGL